MKSLNRCFLHGRLGRDPEVRFLPSGQAKVTLSLATKDDYHDGNEWKQVTDWHDCFQIGAEAERLAETFAKGDEVLVEGRIKTRLYDREPGKKSVKVMEIEVTSILAVSTRKMGAANSSGARQGLPSGTATLPGASHCKRQGDAVGKDRGAR